MIRIGALFLSFLFLAACGGGAKQGSTGPGSGGDMEADEADDMGGGEAGDMGEDEEDDGDLPDLEGGGTGGAVDDM